MRRGMSTLNHNRLQPYGIDSHLMQASPPPPSTAVCTKAKHPGHYITKINLQYSTFPFMKNLGYKCILDTEKNILGTWKGLSARKKFNGR